jgi:hypothetical protein
MRGFFDHSNIKQGFEKIIFLERMGWSKKRSHATVPFSKTKLMIPEWCLVCTVLCKKGYRFS